MKRIYRIVLLMVFVAALLAPATLQWRASEIPTVSPDVAVAACVVSESGSCCPGDRVPDAQNKCPVDPTLTIFKCKLKDPRLCCPDGEVRIALPILKSSGKCVSNTKPGGAIVVYTVEVLKLANLGVGVVIIFIVVWAGLEQVISLGDPARVKSSRDRLQRAITALLLYLTMFALLNFIVPGGIL